MLGRELALNQDLSSAERFYVRIFGVPINGLRIRARRILPLMSDRYRDIMDAGCGPGVFTFEIAKRLPDARVTGYDIDEKLVTADRKLAQTLGLNNCAFELKDLTKMEDSGCFDLILSVDNLEHIEDDADALARFFRALKPGGDLILHVPGLHRRWKLFGWAENFYVAGHYRPGYTKEQVLALAAGAGFDVKDVYYTYGWLETITNNISYWITRAEMENKYLYALVFPFLNFLSYFGQWSRPAKGAGVLAVLRKMLKQSDG